MTLPEFIEREIDRIVDGWEEFARTRIPAAHGMSREALRDQARAMLLDIADDIETSQSVREQREKSRGNRPGQAPPVEGTTFTVRLPRRPLVRDDGSGRST